MDANPFDPCRWVTEAFGETAGYIEGLLKWSSGVLDGAVYPVMMLNVSLAVSNLFGC